RYDALDPGAAPDIFGQPEGGNACNGGRPLPISTTLCNPLGVAVTPEGGFVVADNRNNRAVQFFANTAPAASNVRVTPLLPKRFDALLAQWDYQDDEGQAQSGTQINWLRNGASQSDLFGDAGVPG